MNRVKGYIILLAVIVSMMAAYLVLSKIQSNAEIRSQVLKGQILELQKQAETRKIEAQEADIKAIELDKAKKLAEQKALDEHAKSESLKKRLAVLTGPLPILPIEPSDDPVVLRDQIIEQQTQEIAKKDEAYAAQAQELETAYEARDKWRETARITEEALNLSRQEVRAKEIAMGAMKRANTFQKLKWGAIGIAIGYGIGVSRP